MSLRYPTVTFFEQASLTGLVCYHLGNPKFMPKSFTVYLNPRASHIFDFLITCEYEWFFSHPILLHCTWSNALYLDFPTLYLDLLWGHHPSPSTQTSHHAQLKLFYLAHSSSWTSAIRKRRYLSSGIWSSTHVWASEWSERVQWWSVTVIL